MSDTPVTYEIFTEDKPSYIPAYVMSGFVLLGVISLAHYRMPWTPLMLAHVGLAAWFAVLFVWILRFARQQKMFSSQRLTVTSDTFTHSFRYAVAEAEHVALSLASITKVRVSTREPRCIEVWTDSEYDLYFLPPEADVSQLLAAIRAGSTSLDIDVEETRD